MRKAKGWLGLAGLLLLLAGPAAAYQESFWNTDFGQMTLVYQGSKVTGTYTDPPGMLRGKINDDGTLSGYWLQSKSQYACGYQREGTYYWGTFSFWADGSDRFDGYWTYCDGSGGGRWTGVLTGKR